MKRLLPLTLLVASLVISIRVIAQVLTPISNDEFFKFALEQFATVKNLTTLGIIGLVIQVVVKFAGTPIFDGWFKKLSGDSKFLYVSILSSIGVIVSLVVEKKLSIPSALVNSVALASVSVWSHQAYIRWISPWLTKILSKK